MIMSKLSEKLHLNGIKCRITMFIVNRILSGPTPCLFEMKRKLMIGLGHQIGEGTRIVGPVECTGSLIIGRDCWIGKNLKVNGLGTVTIGNNCDIAPEVTFQTGGHKIGNSERRAGEGEIYNQTVGDGTWIGGRTTIIGNVNIGRSCVVAGCSCVIHDVDDNTLVAGVPAVPKRSLSDE